MDPGFFIPFLIFSIPIIAVTGGIVGGIIKSVGRQRLMELAQRERIAAIERGIDPSKLPGLNPPDDSPWGGHFPMSPRYRAQSLMIGGVITLFAGAGVAAFLMILNPEVDKPLWSVGLIPIFVGMAMLISAWIVWPRDGNGGMGR